MEGWREGHSIPDVFFASEGHLEPSIGLLERAQPSPHGSAVDDVVGRLSADQDQRQDGCIRGGEMRRLAEAASEAAKRVLHGLDRLDESLAVRGHILAQEAQAGEAPVEEPWPARVGGREGAGQLAQLPVQEVDVAAAVQMGQAVGVTLAEFVAGEEGQAFVERFVLDPRRPRYEGVADGGL